MEDGHVGNRLVLPSENPDEWARVRKVLQLPLESLSDLDTMLTKFSALNSEPQVSTFFATVPGSSCSSARRFDFAVFLEKGAPLMIAIALEMAELFHGISVPIFHTGSSFQGNLHAELGVKHLSLSRRQCACLLAHSFFGSLRRPPGVDPNNWRFTVKDLFVGTALSSNSALTFLNYFNELASHGFPAGDVVFERRGYRASTGPPWVWDEAKNRKPLAKVVLATGPIEQSPADTHVEFANMFVGGGVMTGDFAMEEILFLVKPELMIAMAVQHRMPDTEAICVTGAVQFSRTSGYGSSFEFEGGFNGDPTQVRATDPTQSPTRVCAIDAIRGGGPALTEAAMLRDMNKARIAFDGAREVATGHWGCGAFGNNHDLMFLKQWLAASDAGAELLRYHDFPPGRQSHSILPVARKLQHLTVGELWSFLKTVTQELLAAGSGAHKFSGRVQDLARPRSELSVRVGAYRGRSDCTHSAGVYKPLVPSAAKVGNEPKPGGECPPHGAGVGKIGKTSPVASALVTDGPTSLGTGDSAVPTSVGACAPESSLQGSSVLYKGQQWQCVKHTADGRLRLRSLHEDKFTWVKMGDVQMCAG